MKGFPYKVKEHLQKAIDSAILAVEIYNKPAVKFKSGAYITLMIIAWTSIFHAYYFRKRLKPYYKLNNGRFDRKAGELRYWELNTCCDNYFKDDTQNPVRVNLKFFIQLRNKIEHRSMPEIDPSVFAECQAMLLNFDEFIEKEFGSSYCIHECLSFSLQLFPSNFSLKSAVSQNSKNKSIIDFISSYRTAISSDVFSNSKYAFKAYLIQVANHSSKDALPIQFMNYDKMKDAEKEEFSRFITLIKHKNVPVSPPKLFKPSQIVELVQDKLGNPIKESISIKQQQKIRTYGKFNLPLHTLCWKRFKVRPENNSENPRETDQRYCFYDELNGNYGYTKEWADLLSKELSNEDFYKSLFKTKNEPI